LVRIYDKDRETGDLLGASLTNANGEFGAKYRRQGPAKGETDADLYFVVLDAEDRELLAAAQPVTFNADREATVTLTIPK
jgi:hypothetical protein